MNNKLINKILKIAIKNNPGLDWDIDYHHNWENENEIRINFYDKDGYCGSEIYNNSCELINEWSE